MGPDPGAPTVADAAMAYQDPVNGRGGRHLGGRVGLEEELVELAGAPAPGLPELEDLAMTAGAVAWGHCWGRWERSAKLSRPSRR
jgi:hypothetical protein